MKLNTSKLILTGDMRTYLCQILWEKEELKNSQIGLSGNNKEGVFFEGLAPKNQEEFVLFKTFDVFHLDKTMRPDDKCLISI